MSSQTRDNPSPAPRRIAIGLGGLALAIAVLAGGYWLGSGGAAQDRAADGATTIEPAAPVGPKAGAGDGASAPSSSRETRGQAGASGAAPTPDAAQGSAPAEAPDVAADAAEAGASDAGPAARDEAGGTDASVADRPAGAEGADAAVPAYAPRFADHEPEGLAAAEAGALGTPALVMFHSDHCHVCEIAMPTVHQLRERYRGDLAILKVDVNTTDADPAIARYRISGTPTFVLFGRDGSVLDRTPGWLGEPATVASLDRAIALP